MPFDLVAWYETQDASAGALASAVDTGESIYTTKDDDIYVKDRAPLLGGICHLAASTPNYIEIRQPSLRIPYRFSRGEDHNSSRADEGLYIFWDRPLPLYAGEKLNCYVYNATNEITWVVAWLLSNPSTVMDAARARPTHLIRAESDTAAVADAWTNIKTLTWSHDLPKGKYAVVGMSGATYKAATPTTAALRLVLPETTWRPGVMLGIMDADKSQWKNMSDRWDLGVKFPLMPEISFWNTDMPTAEIMAGAANTDHVFELLLQKIQ